ncbi:YtfJ family protein [Pseudobacteriovorax antillogorgiicola]|uniref:Transcriptional regulator n=1 Tax=Pseudobacteriovorax antillogorgiicola TaxID=1513793 RepID=A0A1Y6CFR2_9BACT|nr:YtfJ family protein [Pseudobacteriovorax antillogorgiicola]TCS49033.1 hypothetical protein EDD56_11676 [Pseudobacteriovorax antillogorgiicola]SMF52728.1 hypothetical protein SAMN06296036_11678 [Pseudobacteriovorax antillogorgiicola]
MNKYFAVACALGILSSSTALASLPELHKKPKTIELQGDKGGLVKDESSWSSHSLQNKTHLLVYVDPDESEMNEALTQRLKSENFNPNAFSSVAIINMAATWKPNFAIQNVLEKKQKEYPNTLYVMDKDKVLVKEWELQDDSYDVILFDRDGKVIFRKDGALNKDEIEKVVKLIRSEHEGEEQRQATKAQETSKG